MSQWISGGTPLAVRISNIVFDGLITGYLIGAPKYTEGDPGGFLSGSFVASYQLGFRREWLQPYSRVYFYDKCSGECVFEGDTSFPGVSISEQGQIVEVAVEGGAARLRDWSGARIFIDRDMTAWRKTPTASVVTEIQAGQDRGGSGDDALNLAFPMDTHVESDYRAEAIYDRIREAGQVLGWVNYAWDGGHTSGDPGWLVRCLTTPPSTITRSQVLNVSGSGGSGAVWGGSIPNGANVAYLQLIWTGGSSGTGTSGNDVCWVSILRPVVQAKLYTKSGGFKSAGSYNDYLKAADVWGDLLGDPTILAGYFDGANAALAVGDNFDLRQMAFPDGCTPEAVGEELMKYEPTCTYLVGPSNPTNDKYSFEWMERVAQVRYEFLEWADDHEAGTQEVDQYDRAVARWRSPIGNLRITVSTQSIPEMAAAGRSRTYWQDLSDVSGDDVNAPQANATVLAEHRYPKNGGKITVRREVVDLFTGRRIPPTGIKPGYLCRVVGREAYPDILNTTISNGATVCRIVTKEYDAGSDAATLSLDSASLSMFRAIAGPARSLPTPIRRR